MSVQPDDVPAEVPDHIDPAEVGFGPTPLDEDTSDSAGPDALAELDAAIADADAGQ